MLYVRITTDKEGITLLARSDLQELRVILHAPKRNKY
jgi:hypothetical protein